ncbi:Lipin/Ned1/Smp2-domain-containing protein [Phycomyces nitens]|nr:Lipin/Ned1/Smp2-domain-containing protein [Phycomyces nitens]
MLPGETYRIEMSLCGFSAFGSDEAENAKVFEKHQITYDNFTHNPNLLNDGRLVFRYENRFYAAGRTGPLFTSLLLFRQPLTEGSQSDSNQEASSNKVSDSRESYLFGKGWRKWLSRSSVAAPTTADGEPAKEQTPEENNGDNNGVAAPQESLAPNTETTTFTTTTTTTSVGWTADHSHPGEGDDEESLVPRKNYAKTLRLTSDQLKSLNLKKGVNSISFSVSSAYQGTATCAAKIFFWDHDIQIVISDIDGTITKSDALGHVFTMIGKDWTHNGVAKLYTDIHNNSYHFLYLTSRAIGQADYTRDYLRKVEQNKYQLPDGPVIMSPDRLFTSLHREVIMRKPEMFKMACLKDIQRLFGGRDPFYAGFGNRITDAMSYRTVNVPASRIFTIDPNGEVKLELLQGFKSSYVHLNDLVDQIFPPINKAIDEEYSDWNYWKAPLPKIELPELDLPPTSPKPKPIVPDPSVLPPSSVASVPERQSRGILRSFTSRQPSVAKKPPVVSSTSTPTKLSSPVLEAEKTPEGSVADTSDRESIRSTPGNTSPVSSSIMNKVISGSLGGVRNTLSRTFLSEPPKQDVVEDEDVDFDPELDALDDDLDMESIPFI